MVLLSAWDQTMNFTDAFMEEVKKKEKSLQEFFISVKNMARQGYGSNLPQSWGIFVLHSPVKITLSRRRG